jgi:hypothetical protein
VPEKRFTDRMKLRLFSCLLLTGLVVAGCRTASPPAHPSQPTTTPPISNNTPAPTPIVTPDTSLSAKVVRYNSVGRFVVLSFPVGQVPPTGQTFFLYRAGMKVGEVKITGPQRDNDTVADLTAGDAQEGDDVREQ